MKKSKTIQKYSIFKDFKGNPVEIGRIYSFVKPVNNVRHRHDYMYFSFPGIITIISISLIGDNHLSFRKGASVCFLYEGSDYERIVYAHELLPI